MSNEETLTEEKKWQNKTKQFYFSSSVKHNDSYCIKSSFLIKIKKIIIKTRMAFTDLIGFCCI